MARSKVFVSYSHRDAESLDQLQRFLKTLERDGVADVWADTRLEGGDECHAEIDAALDAATVAVLLISQDFLASDFIYKEEIPRILSRAEAGDLTIVPVFLSPSTVGDVEFPFRDSRSGEERKVQLTKYQGYGTPTKPLSDRSWSDRERIYSQLAGQLKEISAGAAAAETVVQSRTVPIRFTASTAEAWATPRALPSRGGDAAPGARPRV